jgi:DNA adenine methylase
MSITNSKLYKSGVLRYPGGKSRACNIINNELLKNCDISKFNTVVSPFFGGGSFELFLQNKYNFKIIANDKFKPLYIFWTVLQNNKDELINIIKEYKNNNITKELFNEFRKQIITMDNNILQASYYFIINRCSFSGATLSGGFSHESSIKRFTNNSINNLQNINLNNIEFYNKDFTNFINENYKENEQILFLDPPYYLEKNSKLYGNKGDLHENFNHELLFDTIKEKNNWILCYNNCDFIKEIYKNYKIIDVNWSYGMNTSKKSNEILIINFN